MMTKNSKWTMIHTIIASKEILYHTWTHLDTDHKFKKDLNCSQGCQTTLFSRRTSHPIMACQRRWMWSKRSSRIPYRMEMQTRMGDQKTLRMIIPNWLIVLRIMSMIVYSMSRISKTNENFQSSALKSV